MYKNWEKWCRLCGYNSIPALDGEIQLVTIDEMVTTAIMKYFGIMISHKTVGLVKICLMCHNVIKSIVKYNNHILKVNEMFLDLEKNYLNGDINYDYIKKKYGLLIENTLYDYGAISKVKTEHVKTEIEYNISSPKCETNQSLNDLKSPKEYLESSLIEELKNECWTEKITISPKLVKINKESETSVVKNSLDDVGKKHSVKNKRTNQIKNLECEICHKYFETVKGKTIHLKKQHSIRKGPPFKCNTCGRIFKRFQQLNIHESIHLSENERKYYGCPKCDKKFVSEWYVQDHIRIVHERDRRFICEQCGAAFGTNKNLLDHHLTHSEEKKFNCVKCNKAFKCKRTLKFHVETHDDTEYPCHICGLKLNTKRILRRHMLVHSDQNKYKCNFCLKEFKRQYEFKNHLLLHTGLKLYQCSFCELTFSNGSNCRKHQRAVHPVEITNAESKGNLIIVENVPTFKQLVAANEDVLIKKI